MRNSSSSRSKSFSTYFFRRLAFRPERRLFESSSSSGAGTLSRGASSPLSDSLPFFFLFFEEIFKLNLGSLQNGQTKRNRAATTTTITATLAMARTRTTIVTTTTKPTMPKTTLYLHTHTETATHTCTFIYRDTVTGQQEQQCRPTPPRHRPGGITFNRHLSFICFYPFCPPSPPKCSSSSWRSIRSRFLSFK